MLSGYDFISINVALKGAGSGHNGYCNSISSHDTRFSVVATCVSEHSVATQIWNGVGQKSWSTSEPNTDVRYNVYATGYWTVSQGHIWRV